MSEGTVIGIDLGTTNSSVGKVIGGKPILIEVEPGKRFLPSVVTLKEDNQAIVGRKALNISSQYPNRTVISAKRKMGTDDPVLVGEHVSYLPEEVSALILEKLVQSASEKLGEPIERAVITVPAYFNNREREATKQAGQLAGLTVERVLNEPTAACLAYGNQIDGRGCVLVYDLGGGTFDASLVEIDNGIYEVVATGGLSHHGGDDWDARLVTQIVDIVREDTGVEIKQGSPEMQRIWEAATQAKENLSAKSKTTIQIPFLLTDPNYDFNEELTREQFEGMTKDLVEETIETSLNVVDDSTISIDQIDAVLLVGGSSRMPYISQNLKQVFGDKVESLGNPNEAVTKGAAIQALRIQGNEKPLPPGSDHKLQRYEDSVPANTAREVNSTNDIVLIDVTSRSLGVECEIDGTPDQFLKLIDKNTSIPASIVDELSTSRDNQTEIVVPIYQGEKPIASENDYLGELTVTNIPPAPRGKMAISVEFSLDEGGILEVECENLARGNVVNARITSGIELTERELEEKRTNLPTIKD